LLSQINFYQKCSLGVLTFTGAEDETTVDDYVVYYVDNGSNESKYDKIEAVSKRGGSSLYSVNIGDDFRSYDP
jgi:hypothetical protein